MSAVIAAACGQPVGTAAPPAAPPPVVRDAAAATVAAARPTGGVPVAPHPGMASRYPVVAAASCAGHGIAVDPARIALTRDGDGRWRTGTTWGCGCPRGPTFTLAYVPGTAPLEVRLCLDQAQDPCERGCGMPIAWVLDAPLAESHTAAVRVVP